MVKTVVGVMGSNPFGISSSMSNTKQIEEFLQICSSFGVKELDTARVYADGENERMLGEIQAPTQFQIATKINTAAQETSLSHNQILKSMEESLTNLKVQKVDIFYIHMPDRKTPLEETLKAINEVYKEGKFNRFGICSYPANEVQTIYDICQQNEYVLPTVYQGIFNALTRSGESELFPLLRKLGIAFYGFGSTAGGALAKPIEELKNPKKGGRFDSLPFVKDLYGQEEMLIKLENLHQQCQKENISVLEATLRWEKHHSILTDQDAIILGASSKEQIEQNLQALEKGPLPESLVQIYEELWNSLKSNAPPYHR